MQFWLSTPSYKFNQINSSVSFNTKANLLGIKFVDQRHFRHEFSPQFCNYLLCLQNREAVQSLAKGNLVFSRNGWGGYRRASVMNFLKKRILTKQKAKRLTTDCYRWFIKRVDLSYSLTLCRKGGLVYNKRFGCWICQFTSSTNEYHSHIPA